MLTLSNALLFIDLVVLAADVSLYVARLATAALGMMLLLYGLVFESE